MLNSLLKIRQEKRLCHVQAHGQQYGKHVHLLPPVRAAAGQTLKVRTTS